MREREAVGAVLEVAEQQHVHVDRARPVANAARLAAEVALDPFAASSSSSGPSAVRTRRRGVQEVRLVGDLPLRRGLVHRRRGLDRHLVEHQRVARGAQVPQPVADVRAEPEVPDPQAGYSFHTSTETSSTGSGIGGSGFVAFTLTDSAPKRSIRRSATAVHSRSSVRYERSWAPSATCSHTSA